MKNLLTIISILLLTVAAKAQTSVESAFYSAPDNVISYAPETLRMDMVDYYKSGSTRLVQNAFLDGSRILELTEQSITIQETADSAAIAQIFVEPQAKNDSIIILIRNIATPAIDGRIAFYDCEWNVIQLFKADLPLQGRKIKVIAQNGKLQPGIDRVGRCLCPPPDLIQPGQDKAVGRFLFRPEAIRVQAVHLPEQLRRMGRQPWGGNPFRRIQIQLHQRLCKGRGLFFGAETARRFQIAAQVALHAPGIKGDAHTFSLTTTFTKSLGTSRWRPGIWASSGNAT